MSPAFRRLILFFCTALLVAIFLYAMTTGHAPGATPPEEWFKLVVELEKRDRCLYGPDRAFLREMINVLAIDENAIPSATQKRWILSLKRECKL